MAQATFVKKAFLENQRPNRWKNALKNGAQKGSKSAENPMKQGLL